MLPATGSTMTAAMSAVAPRSAARRASRSLYGRDERVGDRARRDAGRVGQPERRDAGARLDEEEVGVAVVAAGELHDLRRGR